MRIHKGNSQQRLSPLVLNKFGNLTPPLLSRRLHKDHASFLTLVSKPCVSDRCQTPGPNISKADSKGRPASPVKLKIRPEDLRSRKRKSVPGKPKNFQYLASLFIEKLVATPELTTRTREKVKKHRKSPGKKQTRICCADRSPIHRHVYEPKATMTDNFTSDTSLQNISTEVSDVLITPRYYNSCKRV